MLHCKNCNGLECVKNGKSRDKQRYKCTACEYNVVLGDGRTSGTLMIKKSLCVVLYSLGKASFGFMAKLFGVSRTTTYNWIKQMGEEIDYPKISEGIKEIEFDEMWHFVQSKKTRDGSSKPWIGAHGELLPGLLAIVMLKPLRDSTRKSNI